MSDKQLTVQTRGIYHGLPTFPSDTKNLTAIITGANGISGYHMLKVLAQSPERWAKIYCLSRRAPAIHGGLPKNAEFVSLDFLKEPAEIAETLEAKGVKAYVDDTTALCLRSGCSLMQFQRLRLFLFLYPATAEAVGWRHLVGCG